MRPLAAAAVPVGNTPAEHQSPSRAQLPAPADPASFARSDLTRSFRGTRRQDFPDPSPDLAAGPGSGEYTGFCPDFPIWPGFREIGESRLARESGLPPRLSRESRDQDRERDSGLGIHSGFKLLGPGPCCPEMLGPGPRPPFGATSARERNLTLLFEHHELSTGTCRRTSSPRLSSADAPPAPFREGLLPALRGQA